MRGPLHCEHARYVDETGFTTRVSIAYRDDVATFDDWFAGSGKAWTDGSALGGALLGRLHDGARRCRTAGRENLRHELVAQPCGAIFGAALQHLGRLGPNARLKLYHGMLRAVQG